MTFEEKHNKLLEHFGISDKNHKCLFYYKVRLNSEKEGLLDLYTKLNHTPKMSNESIWSKSNEYILFTHLLYKKIFG